MPPRVELDKVTVLRQVSVDPSGREGGALVGVYASLRIVGLRASPFVRTDSILVREAMIGDAQLRLEPDLSSVDATLDLWTGEARFGVCLRSETNSTVGRFALSGVVSLVVPDEPITLSSDGFEGRQYRLPALQNLGLVVALEASSDDAAIITVSGRLDEVAWIRVVYQTASQTVAPVLVFPRRDPHVLEEGRVRLTVVRSGDATATVEIYPVASRWPIAFEAVCDVR